MKEDGHLDPKHTMLVLIHELEPRYGDANSELRFVGKRSLKYQEQMDELFQKMVSGLIENNFPEEQAKRVVLYFFQIFEPEAPQFPQFSY